MSTQRFRVQIVVDAINNAGPALKAFEAGLSDSLNIPASMEDAFNRLGNTVGNVFSNLAAQLPQIAIEAVKLGSQVQASSVRFERFAGSAARADELLQSFNEATDNTVDRMGAMSSAGRLLQMGLVSNADEMGRVAKIATMLGDQTLGTTDRMSDFAALLANQSIPRLDNFGISSGKVRARIKELQAQTAGLSREQAFNTAVMEEGDKALARLGDTSDLASTKIATLEAAWKTYGQVLAETTAQLATSGTILPRLASGLNKVAQRTQDVNEGLERAKILGVAPRIYAEAFADAAEAARAFQKDEDELRASIEETTRAIVISTDATQTASGANFDYGDSTDDAESGIIDLGNSLGKGSVAYREIARAAELAAREQAAAARKFTFETGMTWTDFFKDQEKDAAGFADDRESIEQKHVDKLAEITERGQSKSIWINAAAEEAKLGDLQRNLRIALLDQADFTDKTKEQATIRKEAQIAKLQESVASQEQLLANFRAGRLIQAGENISGLLTQEEERHSESLRLLEEAEAEQERVQQESLGRMMLQQFDAWAAINDFTGDRADDMREAIALEYGLIDEAGAQTARLGKLAWETYANNVNLSVNAIVKEAGRVKTAYDEIPREITTEFRIIKRDTVFSVGMGTGENEGNQAGGISEGGVSRMNEGGGEMVILPRGAQVVNNNNTDNFIMNLTSQTPAGPIQEFELMKRLAGR